jgi:hypothetical protein
VPLAERGGAVPAELQDLRDPCRALRPDRVASRIACCQFWNAAEPDLVTVATGEQRRPRGGAHRRHVKAVVAQAFGGQPVQRRCRRDSAEGRRRSEPDVVRKDDGDVRSTLGRGDGFGPVGRRFVRVDLDPALERRIGLGRDIRSSTWRGQHSRQADEEKIDGGTAWRCRPGAKPSDWRYGRGPLSFGPGGRAICDSCALGPERRPLFEGIDSERVSPAQRRPPGARQVAGVQSGARRDGIGGISATPALRNL